MSKKKIYVGLIVILIVVALVILFSGKAVSQKEPEQENAKPVTTGIPANMSISEEVGG